VNIDYHVAFEGHYYSVPHTLVGQEVRIRATERMLAIFHHSQQIAIHPLSSVQGRFSTCADHMPSHHRFVLHTDSDGFLREAAKVGPHTAAYVTAVLRSRPYPQQPSAPVWESSTWLANCHPSGVSAICCLPTC
jgi:hypothetical protein